MADNVALSVRAGGREGGNGEAQHLLVIFNFIVHREN
jgi:hypothetical protein